MLPLTIEEVGGARRSVILTGRGLPFRDGGVSWGAETRYDRQWYAGSSVATIQVLGREELDPQWSGYWADRHVAPFITVSGFPEVQVAQDLVRIFEALRDSGGELRVQWGDYVRRGILMSFVPEPVREVDIPWRMGWIWSSRDDAVSARASVDTPPDSSRIRELLNQADDILAFQPRDLTPAYQNVVRSMMRDVRDRTTAVFELTRQGAQSALSPITLSQALRSEARGLADEARDLIAELSESPFVDSTPSDRIANRIVTEGWRRTMARRLDQLAAQAIRQAREAEAGARPEPTAIVQVRSGQSLRDIALEQYGSADEWQRIAEVNNLQTSMPAPGTYVRVPPLSTPVDPIGIAGQC